VLFSVWSFGQNRIGFGVNSGINRVGFYVDAGFDFDLNSHHVHGGIRYYGPDLVFETNVVGMSMAYGYSMYSGSWFFEPGIQASFFHENKSTSEMYLSEVLVRNRFGYEFGERISLHSNLGLGAVINQNYNFISGLSSVSSYINYEFSLGVIYYWRVPADN
jgi:hypothetical protein